MKISVLGSGTWGIALASETGAFLATEMLFRVGDKDIYLHVVGTTNGVDWVGTICGDGAPMGYAVLEMDGTHVNNSYYKPTKLPAEFLKTEN